MIKILYTIFIIFVLLYYTIIGVKSQSTNESFENGGKKYNVSLCCIIKDERYLEEFVIYYSTLGVEHFYIYDNESKVPIKERLSHQYFQEKCTIIDFPGKMQQLNAYNNCLEKYGGETNWLIFVDGDEYILPKKHANIQDFLREHEDAHAIGVNWRMFGSSNHKTKQSGFLIDKFRKCANEQNKHIKTILKPEHSVKMTDSHTVELRDKTKYMDAKKNVIHGPFNENDTIDIIQINHYHEKSAEDLMEKNKRGTPDRMEPVEIKENSAHNEITDNLIVEKYFDKLVETAKSIGFTGIQ